MSRKKRLISIGIVVTVMTIICFFILSIEKPVEEAKQNYKPIVYHFETSEQSDKISHYILLKNPKLPKILSDYMALTMIDKCNKYNFPIGLMVALCQSASLFNPSFETPKGSVNRKGLLGIAINQTDLDAKVDKEVNLFNVEDNLELGLVLFSEKLKATNGDLGCALKSYETDVNNETSILIYLGEFILYQTSFTN
jgi:hypothetical protein